MLAAAKFELWVSLAQGRSARGCPTRRQRVSIVAHFLILPTLRSCFLISFFLYFRGMQIWFFQQHGVCIPIFAPHPERKETPEWLDELPRVGRS